MPLYVNDFRADTIDLRADEIGIYMSILMLTWQRPDGALPNDMAWLKRSLQSCIAGLHGHQFNRVIPAILDRYFDLGSDNQWRNKRLTLELQKAVKRSANGRQTARKRWSVYRKNKRLADADAMLLTLTKKEEEVSKKERKKEPIQEVRTLEGTYAPPPIRLVDGGRR